MTWTDSWANTTQTTRSSGRLFAEQELLGGLVEGPKQARWTVLGHEWPPRSCVQQSQITADLIPTRCSGQVAPADPRRRESEPEPLAGQPMDHVRCTDLIGLKICLQLLNRQIFSASDRHRGCSHRTKQWRVANARQSPCLVVTCTATPRCPVPGLAPWLAPANGIRHGELQRLVAGIKDRVGLTIQANQAITR